MLEIETVALNDEENVIEIIDQRLLPSKVEVIKLATPEDVWEGINQLKVRGAPAIGVTAAFAIYLAVKNCVDLPVDEFVEVFRRNKEYLNSSRPTAVNLSWALNRMEEVVLANREKDVKEIVELLRLESISIRNEDIEMCRKIGENGLSLVNKNAGILTHCNAGALAATKYGTATAPIYLGHSKGYDFKVYCDETRPLLQGARLTAFELQMAGIDVTLCCDNMVSSLMRNGLIDAVFVGCDRVARNGDVANKIGTSMVAIVAKYYGVPFYVCAPSSTIDMKTLTGEDIVIEQRRGSEVTTMWYERRMTPKGVGVYNPAFDVTNAELISAIITEKGVLRPPFDFSSLFNL